MGGECEFVTHHLVPATGCGTKYRKDTGEGDQAKLLQFTSELAFSEHLI